MRRSLLFMLFLVLILGGAVSAQDASEPPALDIVETLPSAGSVDIAPDGVITVIFNHPVVPLTAVESMENLPDPLQITPAVAGEGEWLNTAIYVFRPQPALESGVTYTVSLDTGLTAQDASQMEAPYSWSFTTTAPALTEVVPEPGTTGVRLDDSLQVRFNMPMDRAATEDAFYVRNADSTGSGEIAGSFEWSDDGAGFRFTPNDNLALDTTYEVGFSSGAVGAGGGTPLAADPWTFTTVPEPAIVRTDPFDGETDASNLYAFTLYFASPMNPETLEGKVTFDPEPWREPDTYYNDYDNSYTLSFPVEPSTDYTVTIAAGAEDIYGNAIQQPLTIHYTTQPFSPDLTLQAPYGVGFYNAYNEQTQVYLTHRNISQVDLSLYVVDTADFLPLLVGENAYDPSQSYAPSSDQLLRSWTIDNVAPENARRYELLDLSAASGVECPGSPASQLSVGANARVISSPDPVRARATPGDGEIVTLLYRDYALRVTGGPECIDNILWWQVALRDGEQAWVAEGVGDEYFLESTSPQVTPVDVTSETGALAPGIYYLQATTPETEANGWQPLKHFLVVGTANLTLKQSVDQALIWATDVQSGEPIAGAPIRVYGTGYELIGEGVTDADGLVRIDLPRTVDLYQPRMAVLDDGQQFGIGLAQWSNGIEGYDFAQPTEYYVDQYRAYVYTDRPIYRPGQPVYFRGVVRERDDVTYTLAALTEIPVRIYGGDDGSLLYDETLPLTPYGTFSGQFDVADDAPLGYYRIEVELPRQDPEQPYYGSEGRVAFQVAQYRAPEFQVDVTPEQDEVVQGDTIRVLVDSRYFFGGVVSNATVDYSVVAQPYYFSAPGAPNYSYTDFNYDAGPSEIYGGFAGEVASGSGTTDAQGQFMIEVPADLKDATQSQTFTIEAVVSDESGQAVAGRTDVVVHKGLLYVGVKPQEYVGTAGQESVVDLIAIDWAGDRLLGVADQTIDVEVVERRWSSVLEEDENGRTNWTWEVEDIPVTSGSVTTGDDGKATFSFVPPAGGVYQVKATTRDDRGNTIVASTTLWVSSGDYIVWRQQNSNRIDLIADRDEYEVGDTAEILIASPFQGDAEALITVERGDVLKVERVTLTSNSYVYHLPITADFAPNAFVSVMIVKGVDENNPVAAFRMGMVQIGVDNSQKELTLDITPDTDQAGPGDEVTYTLRVTDYAGNPVQAEIGVGLTDLASLTIADPNTIPILDYFYGRQNLGVRTSTALTINTDQLTQEVLDTIKGGGGGFGEGGIFDIREEFVDTAYWNAALVTDANGEAQFTITLPDNLTTWRLDARAVTRGTDGDLLVGQDTFDLLSTKPLLIRPVTPRFFVNGDSAVVAALVNNNTDQEAVVDVKLEVGGPSMAELNSPDTQTVTIPAGGRQRVEWSLDVGDAEGMSLLFYAIGQNLDYNDASVPPLGQGPDHLLPIYSYSAPEIVATGGVLEAPETRQETVSLPADLHATGADLTLDVQPSLAAAALSDLKALDFPARPSAEAVVSAFLPNLMTNKAIETIGLSADDLQGELRDNISRALQYLYSAQKVDGGWGWYTREQSDIVVTAYALIGLSEAQAQGFDVDAQTISSAQRFLSSRMIVPSLNIEQWRLNRQAFMLYALARSGAPDVARSATLYESRGSLGYYARALLARTLAIIDPDDPRVQSLLDGLAQDAITSANGVHWEEEQRDTYNWNTDTRTTAIALETYATLRPQSDLLPGMVRWLMIARQSEGWETRQETAWALMGLSAAAEALDEQAGQTADVCAAVDDQHVIDCQTIDDGLSVTTGDIALDGETTVALEAQAGTVYYTAQLHAYLPVAEVEPLNRGIVIERRYTMGDGDAMQTVTGAQVGDTVTVRLTIIAPNDLHYVVVEDPIPAGTDAVNPDLAISQQVGTRPELSREDPLSQGWGWWWFGNIEFRDEKVVLNATYLPAGTYEFVYTIRAGLPGEYNVIPASAREAYFPEVFGRSAGALFTITDAE
ncbi:MAG: Ig-like domain-containing protein [Anaerolineae bacterium]|nr:Ig-like domain-containing protein [Anaerolineae bacterium]